MTSKDSNRPNVIFILSDDQGYWALGSSGNPEIHTPNLDRLAAHGMRFENFFCTSPVCSPARASLLTGRIPSAHGIHDWIREGNDVSDPKKQPGIEYLKGQTGYTDILAASGYVCGLSGKWHLGNSRVPQKGFTHWFAHPRGGGTYYGGQMFRDGELVTIPGYLTDAITEDALAFIDQQASGDAPFYLSVNYTAPHSPWLDQHPPEIVALYDDCPFLSCPQEPQHPGATYQEVQFSKAAANRAQESVPVREFLKGYFAAVTAMDANIGRILDQIAARGLTESTLVIYMSDNGFNCGHHGIWGKGNATFPQNMYDTSVKVPAIFSQPGRIPQGANCAALLSGYDFMPTLLDYLGLAAPAANDLPGRSFFPLLREGQGDAHAHERVVVFDEYGPTRMIRTREWKYVHRYPYGPHELYDLLTDPDEKINLMEDLRVFRLDAARLRQLVEEMKGQMDEWFATYVDPRRDGTHEAITGRGQLNLAGPDGKGAPAFHEREQVFYK